MSFSKGLSHFFALIFMRIVFSYTCCWIHKLEIGLDCAKSKTVLLFSNSLYLFFNISWQKLRKNCSDEIYWFSQFFILKVLSNCMKISRGVFVVCIHHKNKTLFSLFSELWIMINFSSYIVVIFYLFTFPSEIQKSSSKLFLTFSNGINIYHDSSHSINCVFF